MNGNTKTSKTIFILCLVILNNFGMSSCESNGAIKSPRILIIGAGPAGIAATSKLLENGFKNVTILEAEDRIGGRVYTAKLGDYAVDLGGQWVHGEKGNVAFELANPLGLLETSDKPHFGIHQIYLDSDGNLLNEELAKKLSNFYFKYCHETQPADNDANLTMGNYIEKMFDEEFKDNSEILREKKRYLHHYELFAISPESSENWHLLTASDGGEYKECEGDLMTNWKERGYSTILDILMKRYPDPEKELPVVKNTILYSEVMSIDYLNNIEGPPVLVTTTTGQLYKADHVIVTVSLGVLKEKHKSLFIPSLPEEKVNTIEGLGFGSVAKVYVLFDKPFWNLGDERVIHFTFLWNDDEKKQIEEDSEKKWLLGMSNAFTVEHKPNLLELWIAGKSAKEMELLPEEKVFNHSIENLHRFLDKKYTITKPIAMLRTQWYSNQHFRGTYSFRSIESEKRKVYSKMLEKPITPENLTILFAGEATSEHRFSTVDGAIGSGWKAANRVIDHYKNLQTKS